MIKKTSLIKWAFILLLLLVLLIIVAVLFAPDQPKVDYLAEYNRISKPAGFDPNDNAASYFDKAFEIMVEDVNDAKTLSNLWPADMNNDMLQTAKRWRDSNRQAIDYLKQGLSKKYYWKPLKADNNEILKADSTDLKGVRRAVYLLILDSKLTAQQGQIDTALHQLADVYKMGTLLAGPKLLVEQLVGTAVGYIAIQSSFQILDRTNPSPAVLEDFQQRITSLSSGHPFLVSLASERLMLDDEVQREYTGFCNMKLFSEPNVFVWRTFQIIRGYPWAEKERRKADMMYDFLDATSHKTPWQLHNEANDVDRDINEIVKGTYLLRLFAPAYGRVHKISYRVMVHTDGLITTIAVLRYKADKGSFPKDLQELVTAGYLDKLPMDPFSGKPLVYKLSGDNFILYSFAEDLDDDGGKYNPNLAKDGDGDYVFWPVQYSEKGK